MVKYTPIADGLMTISSCDGGSDSRLFMYAGTCDTLIQASYNDDFCSTAFDSLNQFAASITRPVKANKTYYFEWDNAWDTTRFAFTLSLSPLTLRATQTCETATTITPGVTNVDSLFGYALRGDATRANWYKYTPSRNGQIGINSCGTIADTRLWLYRGICSNLTLINASDNDCLSSYGDSASVSISNQLVTAGTTYYFEWDDTWENVPFSFQFTFDATSGVADEKLAQSVLMSPNPASDFVNLDINFEKQTDLTIRILNSIGQTLSSQQIPAILRGTKILDLSALQSGIYVVEISDGVNSTNKKLVISH